MDNYANKLAKESGKKVFKGYLICALGIAIAAGGLLLGYGKLPGQVLLVIGAAIVLYGYVEASKHSGEYARRAAGAKGESDTFKELKRAKVEYKANVILPGRTADIDVVVLSPSLSVVEVKAGGASGEVELLPTGQLRNRHGQLMLNGKDVKGQVLNNARRLNKVSGAPVYAIVCLTNAKMRVNSNSWPGVVVCNLHATRDGFGRPIPGYEGLAEVLSALGRSKPDAIAKVRRVIGQ